MDNWDDIEPKLSIRADEETVMSLIDEAFKLGYQQGIDDAIELLPKHRGANPPNGYNQAIDEAEEAIKTLQDEDPDNISILGRMGG